MAPAYKDGDDRAGMHFRLDYYAQSNRGAVPERRNEMAESWLYWLTFDGLSAARHVTTPSSSSILTDACFRITCDRYTNQLGGPKQLVWSEGSQIDFYDQPAHVDSAVRAAQDWFDHTLRY